MGCQWVAAKKLGPIGLAFHCIQTEGKRDKQIYTGLPTKDDPFNGVFNKLEKKQTILKL